jgi:hypothetical protein
MIRERKRADGTTQGWQARVNDPTDPKRKHRIEKTFRLKKDAQAWEREQRYLMGKGGHIDPPQGRPDVRRARRGVEGEALADARAALA